MDIIISANDEVKKMINTIPLDEKNKISPEKFLEMILSIINEKEQHGI